MGSAPGVLAGVRGPPCGAARLLFRNNCILQQGYKQSQRPCSSSRGCWSASLVRPFDRLSPPACFSGLLPRPRRWWSSREQGREKSSSGTEFSSSFKQGFSRIKQPASAAVRWCGAAAAAAAGAAVGGSSSSDCSPQPSQAAAELLQFLHANRQQFRDADPAMFPKLQVLLDKTTADDFCISVSDVVAGGSCIKYQEVYDGPEMTICIFLLPAGSKLPLHDHPGMHVFGRLLLGKMRIQSYDLEVAKASDLRSLFRERAEAYVITQGEVVNTAPISYSLSPDTGNLHAIKALEDSAFFDVLFPPYNQTNRQCSYFKIKQDTATGRQVAVRDMPWGFSTHSQAYRGPPWPASD